MSTSACQLVQAILEALAQASAQFETDLGVQPQLTKENLSSITHVVVNNPCQQELHGVPRRGGIREAVLRHVRTLSNFAIYHNDFLGYFEALKKVDFGEV
jgi:hypothetical protein